MKILKKIFLIGMILSSAITFSQEKNETIKLNLTVKDYNNKPVPGAIILLDNVKQDKLEKQQKVTTSGSGFLNSLGSGNKKNKSTRPPPIIDQCTNTYPR